MINLKLEIALSPDKFKATFHSSRASALAGPLMRNGPYSGEGISYIPPVRAETGGRKAQYNRPHRVGASGASDDSYNGK